MATVKTVADPRIIDEQGIIMNQYVGPANWEHYKIPASGLSDTQITFANLVTLGTNRLYDSNFEIEYTVRVTLPATAAGYSADFLMQHLRMKGFPLHQVTDQVRCNINGSACMSRPQESLMQRMCFWNTKTLDKTCSYCPHEKVGAGFEPELIYVPTNAAGTISLTETERKFFDCKKGSGRLIGKNFPCVGYSLDSENRILSITIREPVLCPPFNQRLDKLYQRPLFNITSIDIVYQLNDLRVMFDNTAFCKLEPVSIESQIKKKVTVNNEYGLIPPNMEVHIASAQLCFNVASMPTGMTVPSSLTMPYYDNVNYVTAYPRSTYGAEELMVSGVYTLAQVPTAIYIFVAEDQLYRSTPQGLPFNCCPIRSINITMGNNTQLLTTTSEIDRYRMSVANGLQETSWEDFHLPYQMLLGDDYAPANQTWASRGGYSSRCILRLIPGIDLLIPERRLVGGMDADQMVFQVRLTADLTAVPDASKGHMALWIMFEYCGVLTIEPVHASIDMIPIKTMPTISGIDAIADSTVSSEGETPAATPGSGTPEGGGIFSSIWNAIKGLPNLVSKGLRTVSNFISSPQAEAARGIVSSFLGQGDSSNDSGWAQQGARWLGDTIRNRTGGGMDDEPPLKVTKGGTIIGSGTLGKFYT